MTYTASDPSGNVATATRIVRVADVYAPYASMNGYTFSDTSPEFSGTVDNDAISIIITVEGNSYTGIITETGNSSNTWVLPQGTINPSLGVGQHEVTMTTTDAAGNIGTYSHTITVRIPVDISLQFDLINTGTILAGDMVTYRATITNNSAHATSNGILGYYVFPKKLDIPAYDYGY